MSRRKKDPLRELTDAGAAGLTQLSRSQAAPAAEVARATILLAVARGDDYQDAARSAGRRSGDAVSHLVARFNAEGLAALTPRHGGGRRPTYGPEAAGADRCRGRARRRPPRPTAPRPGRSRPCGGRSARPPTACPRSRPTPSGGSSTRPGASYQRTRTWCPTGTALRRRKAGPVVVTDPDAECEKKLIEDAYRTGEAMGLAVWCTDQAGPLPDDPLPRPVLAARGRAGAAAARVPPRRHGQGPDAVPPGRRPGPRRGRDGLPQRGPAPLAEAGAGRDPGRDARARRPSPPRGGARPGSGGRRACSIKPTLPDELPPLRMLLVLDNLAGHKTPEFVCWLFAHGIMPLYTPVGGSWLNMAESIQRILKRRALDGQHPTDTGRDHRLVRGGGAALERGPDAVRVGRQAGGPAAAAAGASPPPGRLGGLHPRPGPASRGRLMATGKPNDPLVFFPASYPRVPLVRVALTVWLSMLPALGSGSFPTASRT